MERVVLPQKPSDRRIRVTALIEINIPKGLFVHFCKHLDVPAILKCAVQKSHKTLFTKANFK